MTASRQVAVATASLMLAAFLIVGIGTPASATAPRRAPDSARTAGGGIVTFAEQPGAPPTYIFPLYDGANSGNNNITYLQPLMWLPLYWFGHARSPEPTVNYRLSMAEPPKFSNDNKTVSITLKHYRWSNGSPVTSRDILFWMHLLLANQVDYVSYVPGGWMTHVQSMADVNTNTFRITFNTSYSQYYLLYNILASITPLPLSWDRTKATGRAGNYDMTPAGAKAVYAFMNKESESLSTWDTNPLWQVVDGPWRLKPKTGFEVTGQTIFIPNTHYSGPDKPRIKEFEELPFTSESAEFDALVSGSVDYGYIPPTDLGELPSLKSQHYDIMPWYEWGVTFLGFTYDNHSSGRLVRQLYIREAMEHLVDQPALIKDVLKGYGKPTYGPVPVYPRSDFVSSEELHNPLPYSVSTARHLLTSHGWKLPSAGGAASCERPGIGRGRCGAGISKGQRLEMTFLYSTGYPVLADEAQVMRSSFLEGGIEVSLREAPYDTTLSESYECTPKSCPSSEPSMFMLSSPNWTYVPIYYPTGGDLFYTGASVAGGYSNPETDRLIVAVRHSSGLSALYAYENYVAKQVPALWFPTSAYQISVISPKLGGVVAQDSTAHIYPSTWYVK